MIQCEFARDRCQPTEVNGLKIIVLTEIILSLGERLNYTGSFLNLMKTKDSRSFLERSRFLELPQALPLNSASKFTQRLEG